MEQDNRKDKCPYDPVPKIIHVFARIKEQSLCSVRVEAQDDTMPDNS